MKVKELSRLLKQSNYNEQDRIFLEQGFSQGFDFQYHGPKLRKDRSRNLKLHCGDKFQLWGKIMKEVKLKRYVVPYEKIPYENYIQSPIGLVPKSGNQTRLIFHLSYSFRQSGNPSVNESMPDEFCTVKYRDLDHAVSNSIKLLQMIEKTLGNGHGVIWYGKTDLKSAFRILPGKPGNFWILIMQAEHPETGKLYFFIDKCMPFGHSISCALFQKFSNALAHIVRFLVRHDIPSDPLTNYLDDFLFMALTKLLCNNLLDTFLSMCQNIGVPVAEEKTEWADTIVVFLGVLLDGKRHVLVVTEEKRIRAINSLQSFLDRRKATVKEVQSLAGLLNFLNRAVFTGRAFTRHMYMKLSGKMCQLRPYHHVRIDKDFKDDCKVWLEFLSTGKLSVCRPFVDLNAFQSARQLDFYMDATKNPELGMGGVFDTHWFFAKWEPGFVETNNLSIEYLELLAVCTGVYIWGKQHLKNSRIVVFRWFKFTFFKKWMVSENQSFLDEAAIA